MTFAKISSVEIQKLYAAKASAVEIIVYQAISSHVHSKTRNNAFPSLRRIAEVIGGGISIPSISRAITALSKKGLIEKGKRQSKKRFILIWRPVKKIAKKIFVDVQRVKDFVKNRYSNDAFFKRKEINNRKKEINESANRREPTQGKEKSNFYEEIQAGHQIWFDVAPRGYSNRLVLSARDDSDLRIFKEWVLRDDTELKHWILKQHKEQIEGIV